MAPQLREWAASGWLNIVGGCCGTTPDHIRAIADGSARLSATRSAWRHARRPCSPQLLALSSPEEIATNGTSIADPGGNGVLHLSGLEALDLTTDFGFAVIGERTNITGSPRFSKLILAGDFEAALAVARQQVEGGANILDVNMDEGMIDSEAT